MRSAVAVLVCLFGLFLVASGCNGGGPGTGGAGGTGGIGSTGTVIVGLTSDLRVGVDIDRLHVVMRASDEIIKDELLTTSSSATPFQLPAEFPFVDLPGGTRIDITLEAFGPGVSTAPLVTRVASTTIVAGKKLLFRVVLDSRCVVVAGSSAPTCTAPQTCVAGACATAEVDPEKFSDYSPSWATGGDDPCKPAEGGAPVVTVGGGRATTCRSAMATWSRSRQAHKAGTTCGSRLG